MALTPVTLSATYKKPDGSACSGTVRFRLVAPINDLAGNQLVAATEYIGTLDASGLLKAANSTDPLELYATEGDDITPSNNAYHVTELIVGQERREYDISLPDTDLTPDLSQYVPVTSRPVYEIVGPQGVQGEQGPSGGPVPTGGAVGQVVQKTGAPDFAVGWTDLSTTYVGRALGQMTNLNVGGVTPAARNPVRVLSVLNPSTGPSETFTWPIGQSVQTVFQGSGWDGVASPNTGWVWGSNWYTVTGADSGDGDGIEFMFGALVEANMCSDASLGTVMACAAQASFEFPTATGHVEKLISLAALSPGRKDGAEAGTADEAYGLYVTKVTAGIAPIAYSLYVVGGPNFIWGSTTLRCEAANEVPLIVKTYDGSQTAAFVEFRNAGDAVLAKVQAGGSFSTTTYVVTGEGTGSQTSIGPWGPGGEGALALGSTRDTVLYRDTGNSFRSSDAMRVDGTLTAGSVLSVVGAGVPTSASSRYVGGTTSGAPASGTYAVGDFVIAQDGLIWVCVTAGSPGSWAPVSPRSDQTALAAGRYYTPLGSVTTAGIPAEGQLQVCRMVVGRTCTINRMAVNCTVSGTTGAVVRMVVYPNDSTTQEPAVSAPLLDAGTVAADSSTGALIISGLSCPVVKGQVIWVGAVVQGGAGTRPTLSRSAGVDNLIGSTDAATLLGNGINAFFVSSVSGAAPSSPAWAGGAGTPIRVAVRADS